MLVRYQAALMPETKFPDPPVMAQAVAAQYNRPSRRFNAYKLRVPKSASAATAQHIAQLGQLVQHFGDDSV